MKINSVQNYNLNYFKQTSIKTQCVQSGNLAFSLGDYGKTSVDKNNSISFTSSKAISELYCKFNKPVVPFDHIKKWVNQFPKEDRKWALKLAETIDYLSYSDTFKELENLHKKLCAKLSEDGFDTETFSDVDFTKAYTCKSGDLISYLYRKANKVRNVCFKTMDSLISNNPDDIENRAIIILDDYTGSGEQFLSEFYAKNSDNRELLNKYKKIYFAPMVANNTSVQNFNNIVNGNYIEVSEKYGQYCPLKEETEDLTYALKQIASDKLQMVEGKIEYPLLSEENKSLSDEEKDEITKFLLKYSCAYPFGYGNTQGHTAFFFTVPNNTPSILWDPKLKSKGLMPLFHRTDDISIYDISRFYTLEEQVR